MGARSGNNYLSSLRKLKAEVWIGTTRVADPTIHPLLVYRARAIASLYDLQMEHPGAMTSRLDDGDRAGLAFIQPRSGAEVQARGAMFRRWAECSGGLLGYTPDGVNAILAAMDAAAPFFAASDIRVGANLHDYYRRARHHDWCAAHTVLEPLAAAEQRLELVERVHEGLIVGGARRVSPLGPLAEELIVIPPRDLPRDSTAERSALAFAINCNARGLKLRCADAIDSGRPGGEAAGSSPFNELACAAIFDHVLIPWDRVFLCGDVGRANALFDETGAAPNLRHQQVVRGVVAAEFRLGSAASLADRCKTLAFPRIREQLAALTVATHLARALLRAAEAGAQQDRWGQWTPRSEPLAVARELLAQLTGEVPA
jgi:4-hydroxyphenylacetate 3-monooxygenase